MKNDNWVGIVILSIMGWCVGWFIAELIKSAFIIDWHTVWEVLNQPIVNSGLDALVVIIVMCVSVIIVSLILISREY